MLPDPKVRCPATGFTKSCRRIVSEWDCPKFVSIKGHDPQTGGVVDRHGCVDSFLPLLLIENAQQSRQTGASVDALRGELKQAGEAAVTAREELIRFAQGGAPPRLARLGG